MSLHALGVENLRILAQAHIELGEGLHWFQGPNGSGKTSLIEAIHLMATGKTFSGKSEIDPLIRDKESRLHIHLVLDDHPPFHLSKIRQGEKRLRQGTQPVHHQDIAQQIPLLSLHSQTVLLVEGSALHRRRFLDWGPFHQKPEYVRHLQRYNRLLRQRNAGLRHQSRDKVLITCWDEQLVNTALIIDRHRREHLEDIRPHIEREISRLLPLHSVELRLRSGWSQRTELHTALEDHLEQDLLRGYTSVGPHRADLHITIDGQAAKERLSRGEKRRLATALRLAQLSWIRTCLSTPPVCLIDDFGNELDREGGQALLDALIEAGVQGFITSTEEVAQAYLSHVPLQSVFHVKHGEVKSDFHAPDRTCISR